MPMPKKEKKRVNIILTWISQKKRLALKDNIGQKEMPTWFN